MISSLFLIHTINCRLLKRKLLMSLFFLSFNYATSRTVHEDSRNVCPHDGVERYIVRSANGQLRLSSKAAK